MRNRFDAQLELLHEKLIEMGNLCEKVISMTYKVLMLSLIHIWYGTVVSHSG